MRKKVWLTLFGLVVIVNAAAWNSREFCDFYIAYIFPVLGGMISRITSLIPFSVGEWLIVGGVLFVLIFFCIGVVRIFVRKEWSVRLFRMWGRAFGWTALIFFWIMTCNCFIQYHASAFEEKYMDQVPKDGYTRKELAAVRDFIVRNLNELAEELPRDAEGQLIYEGNLNETAIAAMHDIAGECEQLDGYYPEPKEMYFSDFISQTHMTGYYFPFSMEANYNGTMYVVNKPSTICHELAHLKGFIQEDEANLIGYMACVNSEDDFFRYSGYMSVLAYVEKEFRKSINKKESEYKKHPAISPQVYADNRFLTEEAWQKVEKKAVVSTETAQKVSRAATTASLKMNGVEEGMKSYEGVVKLLLDYYNGILFGDIVVTAAGQS